MKGAMRRDKKMRQNNKTMSGIEKGDIEMGGTDGGDRQEDRLGEEKKDETIQVEGKEEERKERQI